MGTLWLEIETALAPILGQQGVAALFKRSLYLTGAAHPWLTGRHEGAQPAVDLLTFKALLAQQTSAEAAAGASALLQQFHDLLSSLVGPSLTERLLRSVWAKPLSGSHAQDTSQ